MMIALHVEYVSTNVLLMQFQKAISMLLTLNFAPTAVLVLMYVQLKQSSRNNTVTPVS